MKKTHFILFVSFALLGSCGVRIKSTYITTPHVSITRVKMGYTGVLQFTNRGDCYYTYSSSVKDSTTWYQQKGSFVESNDKIDVSYTWKRALIDSLDINNYKNDWVPIEAVQKSYLFSETKDSLLQQFGNYFSVKTYICFEIEK
jgi:hypothetical protein